MNLPVIQDSGRCTGHCCHRFPLIGIRAFNGSDEDMDYVREHNTDGEFIADMVQPFFGPYLENDFPRFTCRHFDFEAQSCTQYENRPKLCREHGVTSHLCGMKECTLSVKITKPIVIQDLEQFEDCTPKEVADGNEHRA